MPGKKPAVLVVDDDPSIPRLIENQLDCVDVELLINDGVTPVMDTIGALRPAVALVDWHLGRGGDSGEIVVMLNADYPECVQMIVSADAGIECQSRAMSAGAWLYVNKTQIALIASYVQAALTEYDRRSALATKSMRMIQAEAVAARVTRLGDLKVAAESLGISEATAQVYLKALGESSVAV